MARLQRRLDEALPAAEPNVVRKPQSIWQGFLISAEEHKRINRLLTAALLDDALCHRIVFERDTHVMASYGLSIETQHWLSGIHADSLEALAQEIAYAF
ncbi:MAG: hypothetical protein SGJ24_19950 [Chloroflexota bacterium]|nr:hypothetical protein [Chloroflexota bacterium]